MDRIHCNKYKQVAGVTTEQINEFSFRTEVISHFPKEFQKIMDLSDVTPNMIKESLNNNSKKQFQAKQGDGRSGSLFFFTEDKRFIIKTINSEEIRVLESMLDDFIEHFEQNRDSLIAKTFGIFEIKSTRFPVIQVILMENLLWRVSQTNKKKILQFDLKGSLEDRYEKEKQTKKDQNFVEMMKLKHS